MKSIPGLVVLGLLAGAPLSSFAVHPSSAPHQITLGVSAKGEIVVDSGRVTLDELSDRVKAALKATPDLVIAIKAEKDVPLKVMTKVFEACRRVGASKFTIASEEPPTTANRPSGS